MPTPEEINDLLEELEQTTLALNIDSLSVSAFSHSITLHNIMEHLDLKPEDIKMTEGMKMHRLTLLKGLVDRMTKIAIISARIRGEEPDEDEVRNGVIDVLGKAGEVAGIPPGLDFGGDDAALQADYARDGGTLDKVAAAKEVIEEWSDKTFAPAPEEPVVPETETDEGLLSMFRTMRKKKIEEPPLEVEGDDADTTIRANFYNPETAPETPQEFMDYEARAAEYFRKITMNLADKDIIPTEVAYHVYIMLDGDDGFDENTIMTDERKIMQTISDQGQSQAYFEVRVTSPQEAAEAMVTAYSISIARLRGLYVQQKLAELDSSMSGDV